MYVGVDETREQRVPAQIDRVTGSGRRDGDDATVGDRHPLVAQQFAATVEQQTRVEDDGVGAGDDGRESPDEC